MNGPTLALTDQGISYAVSFDRWDAWQPERACWCYRITLEWNGNVVASGSDLTTVPRNGSPNYAAALETLLTFLSAAMESDEQRELFPTFPFHAVSLTGDEIAMLAEALVDGEAS